MNILNKILNCVIFFTAVTLVMLLSFTTVNNKYTSVNTAYNADNIPFNEENILKYSKEYYESKYDTSDNMHYIICDGGNENGKFYCIVKIKSLENIKNSPSEYFIKLKVYDDGKIMEFK